ncbi:hypothetical protein QEN19_003839 [Hanseniaspora menglaensis]
MSGPPPPPAPPSLNFASAPMGGAVLPDRNALLNSIRQGKSLKKAETNDRSAPTTAGGVIESGYKKPEISMAAPPIPVSKNTAASSIESVQPAGLAAILQNAIGTTKHNYSSEKVQSLTKSSQQLEMSASKNTKDLPAAPPLPTSVPKAPPIPSSVPPLSSVVPIPASVSKAPTEPYSIPEIPPILNVSVPSPLPTNTVSSNTTETSQGRAFNGGGLPFLADIQKRNQDSFVKEEDRYDNVSAPQLPTGVPVASPLPTGVPAAPPLPTGVPAAPPLPTGVPAAPPLPTGVPAAPPLPTGVPTAPPLPTGVPAAPPLPTEVPVAPPLPTGVPVAPPLPTGVPVAPPLPTGVPVAPPLPTGVPVAPPLPTGVPVAPPLPTAAPKAPPLPTGMPVAPPLPLVASKAPPLPTGVSAAPPAKSFSSTAGALPFLAEIQKKRDDTYVVDESNVAQLTKPGNSNFSPINIPQPPISEAQLTVSNAKTNYLASAPVIPVSKVPNLPLKSPEPPKGLQLNEKILATAPTIPVASAPGVPSVFCLPEQSTELHNKPQTGTKKFAPPPPPQEAGTHVQNRVFSSNTANVSTEVNSSLTSAAASGVEPKEINYRSRLFGSSNSTSVDQNEIRSGRPDAFISDSSTYTNRAGQMITIKDVQIPDTNRFKFNSQHELPIPRPFQNKTKLYPSGRGSSVPLNLKLYQ